MQDREREAMIDIFFYCNNHLSMWDRTERERTKPIGENYYHHRTVFRTVSLLISWQGFLSSFHTRFNWLVVSVQCSANVTKYWLIKTKKRNGVIYKTPSVIDWLLIARRERERERHIYIHIFFLLLSSWSFSYMISFFVSLLRRWSAKKKKRIC